MAVIIIFCLATIIALLGVLTALQRRSSRSKIKFKFLELLPPLNNDRQIESIEMFYKVLHNLVNANRIKFWQPTRFISLELVSDRAHGIRFIAVVPSELESSFRAITIAHLTDVKIKNTGDYIGNSPEYFRINSYKLRKDFSFR